MTPWSYFKEVADAAIRPAGGRARFVYWIGSIAFTILGASIQWWWGVVGVVLFVGGFAYFFVVEAHKKHDAIAYKLSTGKERQETRDGLGLLLADCDALFRRSRKSVGEGEGLAQLERDFHAFVNQAQKYIGQRVGGHAVATFDSEAGIDLRAHEIQGKPSLQVKIHKSLAARAIHLRHLIGSIPNP